MPESKVKKKRRLKCGFGLGLHYVLELWKRKDQRKWCIIQVLPNGERCLVATSPNKEIAKIILGLCREENETVKSVIGNFSNTMKKIKMSDEEKIALLTFIRTPIFYEKFVQQAWR